MGSFFAKYKMFGIVMLVLSGIIVYLFYNALQPKKMLPVYQPSMVDKSLVDSTLHYTKKYHKVADFSLVNQNGETITQENYKDKIYNSNGPSNATELEEELAKVRMEREKVIDQKEEASKRHDTIVMQLSGTINDAQFQLQEARKLNFIQRIFNFF